MKRLLSIVALVGLSGLGINLAAQQTQSTPTATDPAAQQQQQTDATNPQQSARSFEGKIAKSGDQLVLQDNSTQTASAKLTTQRNSTTQFQKLSPHSYQGRRSQV